MRGWRVREARSADIQQKTSEGISPVPWVDGAAPRAMRYHRPKCLLSNGLSRPSGAREIKDYPEALVRQRAVTVHVTDIHEIEGMARLRGTPPGSAAAGDKQRLLAAQHGWQVGAYSKTFPITS